MSVRLHASLTLIGVLCMTHVNVRAEGEDSSAAPAAQPTDDAAKDALSSVNKREQEESAPSNEASSSDASKNNDAKSNEDNPKTSNGNKPDSKSNLKSEATATDANSIKKSDVVQPAAVAEGATEIPDGAEISNGERFSIDGKGFSIAAPVGWAVQKNLPKSSLFLQARVTGAEYPRNIAVVRFKEPKLINDETAGEFAERLVKLYPSASTTIEKYTLRNHQSIQMADGRQGILFYTDFVGSGRNMMQAHVLVSSETNHYLVSYTDIAEHFENPGDGSQFLADAWASMISIQLDTPNPVPAQGMQTVLIGLGGLLLFATGFTFIRKYFAARQYREYGNLEPGEKIEGDVDETSEAEKIQDDQDLGDLNELSDDAVNESDDEKNEARKSEMDEAPKDSHADDDGIHSGFSKRILTFRNKSGQQAEDSVVSKDEMEFTDDPISLGTKEKLKKGA